MINKHSLPNPLQKLCYRTVRSSCVTKVALEMLCEVEVNRTRKADESRPERCVIEGLSFGKQDLGIARGFCNLRSYFQRLTKRGDARSPENSDDDIAAHDPCYRAMHQFGIRAEDKMGGSSISLDKRISHQSTIAGEKPT
jgi:hypothetical protein